VDEVRSKMMSVIYHRQSAIELNYFTLWFLESLPVLGCGGVMILLCLWLVKLLAVPVCSCLHRYVSSLVTA
jgi:hypothetical protein